MNKLAFVFALSASAALPALSNAQPAEVPAPAPVPARAPAATGLSEQLAVERAVANNPNLHVALLQAQQADVDVRAEEGLYSAIARANGGFTHTRQPGVTGIRTTDTFDLGAGITKPFAFGTVLDFSVGGQRSTGAIDSDIAGASGDSGPYYSLIGQLQLTQPLLRGAGTDIGLATLRQARLRRTSAQQAADAGASSLLSEVLRAYWELWYADRVIGINRASLALATEQARQAGAQVRSGALAPIDALVYETRRAELDEAVVLASTERRQRSLALALLLADPRGATTELVTSDSPAEPAPGPIDVAGAVADAERASPELAEARTRIQIVRDQARIAGDASRPRLDLDAHVAVRGFGNQRVPPAFEQAGRFEAVSAGVGLTFEAPIDTTRRRAQIASAQLDTHIAEGQLEATRQRLRSDVLSALSARDSAEKRVQVAAETVRVAGAQAEAERRRFAAGTSIAIQVQEAEDSLRQAELRLERARVDRTLSDVTLAYLRGRLLERYRAVTTRLPAGPPRLDSGIRTAL
jgi:outer membrane protein TolC